MHNRCRETFPCFAGELQPEIADGVALENDEEEEKDGPKEDDRHRDSDNPDMEFEDADSEEVKAD